MKIKKEEEKRVKQSRGLSVVRDFVPVAVVVVDVVCYGCHCCRGFCKLVIDCCW